MNKEIEEFEKMISKKWKPPKDFSLLYEVPLAVLSIIFKPMNLVVILGFAVLWRTLLS